MKFSFSTLSCPTWDLPTVLERAKEYGYDGVELPAFFRQSNPTAIDLFAEATAIPPAFAATGLAVACISTPVTFHSGRGDTDAREAENLKYAVMVARQVNCPIVRLPDPQLIGVEQAFAEWLIPLAEYAARHSVTLVIENATSLRTARPMWGLMDRVNHPSVRVSWNPLVAETAGESPGVSVPTLNSRIGYVRVPTVIDGEDVPLKPLLKRLRGIGYAGWVSVQPQSGGTAPEQVLSESIRRLREWTKPQKPPAKAAAVAGGAEPAGAPARPSTG